MDETWRALAREAGLAAEHIAFGVTVLGRANYAQPAYYAQAFFSLSIGFERSCKLALLLSHALDNAGQFPANSQIRRYGHNLEKLLTETATVANRRHFASTRPETVIHQGIVETLSEFADNVTRYYNLDVITGETQVTGRTDPIASWNERVTGPILQAHYTERIQRRHEADARILELVAGPLIRGHHESETGHAIDSALAGALSTAKAEFARRWERMYVLQIARFVGNTLVGLSDAAHALRLQVPFLNDFFYIFSNDDAYFRERKTWSTIP